MPLKTYLGDGDIDLTVICSPDDKELLAEGMYAILKYEEQNMYAEYTVKDTKMIGAEVLFSLNLDASILHFNFSIH